VWRLTYFLSVTILVNRHRTCRDYRSGLAFAARSAPGPSGVAEVLRHFLQQPGLEHFGFPKQERGPAPPVCMSHWSILRPLAFPEPGCFSGSARAFRCANACFWLGVPGWPRCALVLSRLVPPVTVIPAGKPPEPIKRVWDFIARRAGAWVASTVRPKVQCATSAFFYCGQRLQDSRLASNWSVSPSNSTLVFSF